jgi:hypothetical protein
LYVLNIAYHTEMNHRIIEKLWGALSKSRLGRFLAAAIIGALFVAGAAAKQSPGKSNLAIWSVAGAVMGILAVGILEILDSGRSKPVGSHRVPREQGRPPVIQSQARRSTPPPIPVRPQDSPPQRRE